MPYENSRNLGKTAQTDKSLMIFIQRFFSDFLQNFRAQQDQKLFQAEAWFDVAVYILIIVFIVYSDAFRYLSCGVLQLSNKCCYETIFTEDCNLPNALHELKKVIYLLIINV